MYYRFTMDFDELKTALKLLNESEIPDVINTDIVNDVSQSEYERMINKRFINKNGKNWNIFVYLVFGCVFGSDCKLKLKSNDDLLRVVYFKDNVVSLLIKDEKKDEYNFYLSDDINNIIAELSLSFDYIKDYMIHPNNAVFGEIEINEEFNSGCELKEAFMDNNKDKVSETDLQLTIEGFILDYIECMDFVCKFTDTYVYVRSNNGFISYESVDYNEFTDKLSEWIIEAHENCKRWGEQNE